ncbi:MAG: NTP transferase domain-containing protein [Firmicutes bacterium]|nr:NTP transferase domain-containing protein [Bacillota bacterium]
MIDCVVLAGGPGVEMGAQEAARNKALLKIGRQAMVSYVLQSYRRVQEIERMVLVGPVEELNFLQAEYALETVPESGSLLDNLLAAIRFLQTDKPVLISTADIPLVSPAAVEDFLHQCASFEHDFYYPIVSREDCEKKFPGMRRTYVSLQEGSFTGGNIFLVNPTKIEPAVPLLRKFMEHRKNPLKMVSLLGTGFVLRALAKKISIPSLEARFSELFQISARAIISRYAEISFDVDKDDDLLLARQILESEQAQQ